MLTVTSAASNSDLTVLATLKTELQISDTDSDTYLADVIDQASDAIARYCGRTTFGRETVTQTERLTWRWDCIVLDRDIAPTITSVVEDGTTLTAAEYELDGSILYRLDANDERKCWAVGKVVIVYSAGYTLPDDVPSAIERACLDLCKLIYSARGRDPALRREKILDVIDSEYTDPNKLGFVGGLPADIAQRLDPYRLLRGA